MCDWIKSIKIDDEVVFIGEKPGVRASFRIIWNIRRYQRPTHFLIVGERYKVSAIGIQTDTDGRDHVCLWLGGFRLRAFKHTLGFPSYWFRPVQKRNTEISVFTDMLKTVSKPLEIA